MIDNTTIDIYYNQVDLVREREEIQVRIDQMLKGDIPTLTIVHQLKVSQKGLFTDFMQASAPALNANPNWILGTQHTEISMPT